MHAGNTSANACPVCGEPLFEAGFCGVCLLAGGLPEGDFPASIGPYRILRVLGEGGMGVVYEAEQDHPYRKVALKTLRTGSDTPELARRFAREAGALARLQHPAIAQIYEAGTADTDSGAQPYFAMEFIHGEPLDEYAETHDLSIRERLHLMCRVCDGVEHAHQRGVIHRDLKPANILVDDSGQPKILDFGVARITDLDALHTRQTSMGQVVGTLAYMSPEQVAGGALDASGAPNIDIRSDVYTLGILLYELLARRRPYDIGGQLLDAVRTIRDEDPALLGSIDRKYRGDIETIVARAIEKDRARRYASAAALADDMRRHLEDKPIAARPASTAYQVSRFARRHRALVAGVTAVFLALTGGVIASTIQATRARQAERVAVAARQEATRDRDRALAAEKQAVQASHAAAESERQALAEKRRASLEADSAKAVNDFLTNDLLAQADVARQSPGATVDPDLKVRTALDRAADRIGGRFGAQPEVEASIRGTIGQTYRGLGLHTEARKQVELALEIDRRVLGQGDPKTLSDIARLARIAVDEGKYPEAESLFSETLEKRRHVLGPTHPDTLATMSELGNVYLLLGRAGQAEALVREALAGQRRVLPPDDPAMLETMNNLARIYERQGKNEETEPLNQRILEIRRRVLGPEHPSTLISMNNLASRTLGWVSFRRPRRCLRRRSNSSAACLVPSTLAHWTEWIIWRTPIRCGASILKRKRCSARTLRSGAGPWARIIPSPSRIWARWPAWPRSKAGSRRRNGSMRMCWNRSAASSDRNIRLRSAIRLACARPTGSKGKYPEAQALLNRTLEAQRRVLGPEHPFVLESEVSLALTLQSMGKSAESEPVIRHVMEVNRSKQPGSWQFFLAESLLGASLAQQRKYAEAEPLLLEGYRGMEARKQRIDASNAHYLERVREAIFQLYQASGRPGEAAHWQ